MVERGGSELLQVPVPEGLDLEAWINPPEEEGGSSEEEEEEGGQVRRSRCRSRGCILLKVFMREDQEKRVEVPEPSEQVCHHSQPYLEQYLKLHFLVLICRSWK